MIVENSLENRLGKMTIHGLEFIKAANYLQLIMELSQDDKLAILSGHSKEKEISTTYFVDQAMKYLESTNYFDGIYEVPAPADLVADAAEASETFGDDELESHAAQNQIVEDITLLEAVGRRVCAAYPTLEWSVDDNQILTIQEPDAETMIWLKVQDGKVGEAAENYGIGATFEPMGSTDQEVFKSLEKGRYFDLVNGEEDNEVEYVPLADRLKGYEQTIKEWLSRRQEELASPEIVELLNEIKERGYDSITDEDQNRITILKAQIQILSDLLKSQQ